MLAETTAKIFLFLCNLFFTFDMRHDQVANAVVVSGTHVVIAIALINKMRSMRILASTEPVENEH